MTEIGIVGGFNGFPTDYTPYQYDFVPLPLIWGWVGWRHAREGFDPDMKDWVHLRQTDFLKRWAGSNIRLQRFLKQYFDRAAGLAEPHLNS